MEKYTSVISPDAEDCGSAVKLGAIDQIAPRCYITTYIFFRMAADADRNMFHQNIQTALCHTLKEIPQLMATIRPLNNGREELELVYSPERGALLTSKDYVSTPERRALWPHGTFDELAANYFPYSLCEKHLVLSPVHEFPDDSMPSLAIQTNFIPGGMILSSQLNHTVCDGTGNFLFYQTFSKHITQVSKGEAITKGPTINFMERTQIVEPDHDVHINEFPEWKPVESEGKWHNPVDFDATKFPKVCHGVFYISGPNLKKLTKRLTTEDHQPSSIEALGAFLWQQVISAREIDPLKYPEAKLSVAIDMRKRTVEPEVPGNFWGNFSEPNAVARMPTRSLLQPMTGKPTVTAREAQAAKSVSDISSRLTDVAAKLGVQGVAHAAQETIKSAQDKLQEVARSAQHTLSGASQPAREELPASVLAERKANEQWEETMAEALRRIRVALMSVDNTAVRRLVGLLNQMPKSTSLTWNVDRWPGPDMLIICVNFHPYYQLDFGPLLGFPVGGRFTIGDTETRPDGRCLVMPPRPQDGRGLEVVLQYDVVTINRLMACPDFMQYFERRC